MTCITLLTQCSFEYGTLCEVRSSSKQGKHTARNSVNPAVLLSETAVEVLYFNMERLGNR